MSRRECSACKVQTQDFSCKNCGSTVLLPVALAPLAHAAQRSLLERSHDDRARRDMLTR
jgi:hypothetical protein